MKTKILSLLLLFLISNCFSQTIEDLKIATLKMYDAAYNMDFETIVDLTYPKVLDNADRELLIKSIDKTFQNDIFQMRFVYPTVIFNYSEMKIIDDKKFYVIRYKSAVRYKHEQKISTDSVEIILNRMR